MDRLVAYYAIASSTCIAKKHMQTMNDEYSSISYMSSLVSLLWLVWPWSCWFGQFLLEE